VNSFLYEDFITIQIALPYEEGGLITIFHEQGQVERLDHKPGGVEIQGRIPGRLFSYFNAYQKEN
jgi:GTP-binding protein HflX